MPPDRFVMPNPSGKERYRALNTGASHMKRFYSACGLFGALLLVSGCGSSKPEVPSWFKGDSKKEKGGDPVVAKNSPEQLQRDLQTKIRQLEKKQTALEEAITSVDKSKREIVTRLHNRGVKSLEDLNNAPNKNDEDIQRWKTALLKNRQEYAKYMQMQKEYNIALFDGKDALERLGRQLTLAKAGISEKELEDLALTIRKIDRIDDRLNGTDATNPVELIKGDSVLEKELKSGN
jgi:hypothetical protein